MARILVTGASGFVGSALVAALAAAGLGVRASHRTLPPAARHRDCIAVGDLDRATDWTRALDEVGQVVHLAGPAHRRADPEDYRREIVDASDALAAQAASAGVKRFVFVSSIKAGGERGGPLREADAPAPESAYGQAKLEAERRVLAHSALAPVALRPPLVHAADAKANFARLLRLADTPLPLPLAGLTNRRSVIARDTLIAAIIAVLAQPAGASGAFYVTDKGACSTADMVRALRAGMGRRARLFSAPMIAGWLPAVLTESLEADDSAFRAGYGFDGGADALEGLRRCGAAWKARA